MESPAGLENERECTDMGLPEVAPPGIDIRLQVYAPLLHVEGFQASASPCCAQNTLTSASHSAEVAQIAVFNAPDMLELPPESLTARCKTGTANAGCSEPSRAWPCSH